MNNIEITLMAHRYLYYVLGTPVISDFEYDKLEQKARQKLPPTSPINSPGSSLMNSYPLEVRRFAEKLLNSGD